MAITINIHAESVGELRQNLRQLLAGAAPSALVASAAINQTDAAPLTQLSSALSSEADKPKATRTKVQPAAQTIAVAELTVDDMIATSNAKAEEQRATAAAERTAREAAEAEINAKIATQHEAEVEAAAKAKAAHEDVDGAESANECPDDPLKAIDYEADIKPRVIKLAEAKGRAGVLAVFDTFGVDHASKVPVESYGKLVAALDSALGK